MVRHRHKLHIRNVKGTGRPACHRMTRTQYRLRRVTIIAVCRHQLTDTHQFRNAVISTQHLCVLVRMIKDRRLSDMKRQIVPAHMVCLLQLRRRTQVRMRSHQLCPQDVVLTVLRRHQLLVAMMRHHHVLRVATVLANGMMRLPNMVLRRLMLLVAMVNRRCLLHTGVDTTLLLHRPMVRHRKDVTTRVLRKLMASNATTVVMTRRPISVVAAMDNSSRVAMQVVARQVAHRHALARRTAPSFV